MAEIKKRWYVLRVIGGKEKKVKEYIENEVASLGLQDYVSPVSYTHLTLPTSDLV